MTYLDYMRLKSFVKNKELFNKKYIEGLTKKSEELKRLYDPRTINITHK
jgi:hypothetical protein